MGIGTSVLLKMNAERVLEQLDIEAEVDATDITTALRDDSPAQIALCTPELRDQLKGIRAEIITEVDHAIAIGTSLVPFFLSALCCRPVRPLPVPSLRRH